MDGLSTICILLMMLIGILYTVYLVIKFVVQLLMKFVKDMKHNRKKETHWIQQCIRKAKKNYQKLNTILPILIIMSLYVLPIKISRNYYDNKEYHFIYERIDCDDLQGVIYTLLVMPFVIIILNWTYKVLQIQVRILHVVNMLLYTIIIITFLVFFAKDEFVFLMLIPMLLSLCAILLSKSLIDDTTKNIENMGGEKRIIHHNLMK